ncbi:MAG: hypothetical protein U5K54_12300 [Cytophagales bacterium]|nr:hypothetical protein [Cytophagales bacterium]
MSHFDVAGYDAYHQFPIYHRSWISTNYLVRRYEFIRKIISENQAMPDALKVDVVAFVQSNISNATASNAQALDH